jgi:hypothetical protein
MIRLFILIGSLALATATLATAQSDGDIAAIRDVISRQLDAIKSDHADDAFAIASPAIKSIFGDSATFMAMVARGYPQIYRSRSHRFLNTDDSDGKLNQRVLVEGETGSVIVRYEMIEIDGQWRINGCSIEKVDEA